MTRTQLAALGFGAGAIAYPGRRTSRLTLAGFSTLRITDHRLKHHPTKEAQRLEHILRSRSP